MKKKVREPLFDPLNWKSPCCKYPARDTGRGEDRAMECEWCGKKHLISDILEKKIRENNKTKSFG